MKTPKISVLMPIWNTPEKYLREAIDSILSQTFTDFEFLILNDSPDNTALDKIVTSYQDKRIIYVKNTKNLGITPSRNKLIDMAKGEYLAVMDHDDISLPTRFEKEVAYLDKNPNVGVVGCKVETFPDGTMSRVPSENDDIRLAMMKSCAIIHPASMIRKSVLIDNNIRYEKSFSPCEDYALFYRLMPRTQFHNLTECLFKYRHHKTNTSKTQSQRMKDITLSIHSMMEAEYPTLYREFLLRVPHIIRVRLFGLIPFLKIVTKGYQTKIYLFEKIPLLTYKKTIKLQENKQ